MYWYRLQIKRDLKKNLNLSVTTVPRWIVFFEVFQLKFCMYVISPLCPVFPILFPRSRFVRLNNILWRIWKDKTAPATGDGGPWGCETSKLPHFLDSWLTDGAVRFLDIFAGRPLPPERFLLLISVRDWVDPKPIERLEGLSQFKCSVTSSGIELATFRLVASTNCGTACNS
jgi:hypothetical protein